MLQDPQTLARDMVKTVEHPLHGAVRTIGFPVKFSRTPASVEHGAPLYGQHMREILAACGYSEAQVDAMIEAGAVAGGDSELIEDAPPTFRSAPARNS